MGITPAVAICVASGYSLIASAWPRSQSRLSARLMKLALAAGFGLGLSSVAFFLARAVGHDHFVMFDLLLLTVLGVLLIFVRLRPSAPFSYHASIADFGFPSWLRRTLVASFVFAVVAALYSATALTIAHPHGNGWDAFAIWNLRARFLVVEGSHWRDGFTALLPWSHPDYPLLLPAATARFWIYLDHTSPSVPAILGLVFTFSSLTLLVTSLFQLRGPNAGLLAGIVLSSTPFFVEQGTAQYADVPLSFFILATLVCLHFGFLCEPASHSRRPMWMLSGVAAGFAGWTKNEGLLFLAALLIALSVFSFKNASNPLERTLIRRRDVVISCLGGALPILAVIAWFKHSLATPGDLLSPPDVMVQKLLTPSRYGIISRWYLKELLKFGDWWIVPGTILLALLYFLVHRKVSHENPLLRTSTACLLLTLAGYFAIYLITPRDLYWHLRFSLNRLFLQLWPATIFLFCLFTGAQGVQTSQDEPKVAEKALNL